MTVGASLTGLHAAAPSKPSGKAGGKPAAPVNPLAPLTPQQIQQQATKTVTQSYAPSYQNLNQQQTQAQNIANKREADNRYYLTWLDTQGHALQSHADAANQTLDNLEQQLTGNQATEFGALPGQLVTAAGERAGNVSNESNANAFGRYLSPTLQSNEQALHGSAAGALAATGNTTDMIGAANANSGAFVEAGRQKQMGELNAALTSIGQQRSKLQSSEPGALTAEIGRLQNVEISKAEYNQNYATAATKLGVTIANTKSEIGARQAAASARQAGLKIQGRNSDIAAGRAQNAQLNADRNYKLNVAKYNSQTAKDIYERDHGLGPYRVSQGHGHSNHPLSQTSQNTIYNKISTVEGTVRQLLANGADHQTAYHTLLNGGMVNVPTGRTHNVKQTDGSYRKEPIYRTVAYKPPDVQILNAAYNIATGLGLTKGDVSALQKMGLAHPGQRLKLATPQYGGAQVLNTPGVG